MRLLIRFLAPYTGAMTPTATIRVPLDTRDRLALVARSRSESLSAYLTKVSQEAFKAAMIMAARDEAIADGADPAADDEYSIWEGTSTDGVD